MTVGQWHKTDAGKQWFAEYRRQWRRDHPDAIRDQNKRNLANYAQRYPERILNNNAKHRAIKRGAWVELVDRLEVLRRHNGLCGICGNAVDTGDFHVDHIIPLARGGEHSYANTQPSHPLCNLRKGTKG